MISEEDKQRYIEASKCKDCLDWLHHCKAECCKIVSLNVAPKELEGPGNFIKIKVKQPFKEFRYYQLRDVGYVHGFLRFKKDRIVVVGRKVLYIYPCKLLDENNLCKGHPDKKPEICKMLTLEAAKLPDQPFMLTDNCLFKYKCKEVIEND